VKGYIQVYTGNGKGKTTAAIGLAIELLLWEKVFIAQFIKGMHYSELDILKFYSKY
jgi:cob(I)alamin adenosyltransferase